MDGAGHRPAPSLADLAMVEVGKADTSAYPEPVHPTTAPYVGKGRRPRPRYHDPPSALKQLALAARQRSCVELIWRRGSRGRQRSCFLVLRVRPAGVIPRRLARAAGAELPLRWLLVEWPQEEPELVKYWLSNLPDTTQVVELIRLGKLRWRIEQDYRELKGPLGLDHFEGRSCGGWHHHVTLVSVAHGFSPWSGSLPKSGWRRLTLWQLLEQLQVLLACWAGACPGCRRPAPRWLSRQGRSGAPT